MKRIVQPGSTTLPGPGGLSMKNTGRESLAWPAQFKSEFYDSADAIC